VGKNNAQNDELTMRRAEPGDLWFHVKDSAGSHVILKTGGTEPPDSSKEEAAMLAAYFSKARGGALVPVDYVERRHVRKPKDARPGYVIYDNHKTAYITPSEIKYNEIKNRTAGILAREE